MEQELAPEKSSHQVGCRRLRPSGAVGATSSVRILSGESVRTVDPGSDESRRGRVVRSSLTQSSWPERYVDSLADHS